MPTDDVRGRTCILARPPQSAGLPVGLQLVGPQHADLVVIRAAAALEEAIGFDAVAPFPA